MTFRQALFWDVNPKKIDAKKHSAYVIERILDFGNDQEARWIWNFYGKKMIKKIIATSKVLRPQTKVLWTLILKK